MTPTQRTLAFLRREGWLAAVVEKYMKFPGMPFGRRIDVFGFADVLACFPSKDKAPPIIALVQTCAGASHANRRRKIEGTLPTEGLDEKEILEAAKVAQKAKFWKRCGGTIMVISWAKKSKRGQPKRWEADVEIL